MLYSSAETVFRDITSCWIVICTPESAISSPVRCKNDPMTCFFPEEKDNHSIKQEHFLA